MINRSSPYFTDMIYLKRHTQKSQLSDVSHQKPATANERELIRKRHQPVSLRYKMYKPWWFRLLSHEFTRSSAFLLCFFFVFLCHTSASSWRRQSVCLCLDPHLITRVSVRSPQNCHSEIVFCINAKCVVLRLDRIVWCVGKILKIFLFCRYVFGILRF